VGTGLGILPVIIDQVVTCVCMVSRPNDWKTIQNIACNNNFPNKLITNFKQQIQHNTTHQKSNSGPGYHTDARDYLINNNRQDT